MTARAPESGAIAVIRAIYDGVARGDWAGVEAKLDPDIVVVQSPDLPFRGEWRGLAGFQALGAKLFACWPDFRVEPTAFYGDAQTVVVITRLSGRHPGAEISLDQDMVEVWTVRNGRAVTCRPFYFAPGVASSSTTSPAV